MPAAVTWKSGVIQPHAGVQSLTKNT